MNNNEFEKFADRFYRETGFLAPGKDDTGLEPVDEPKRSHAWNEFIKRDLFCAEKFVLVVNVTMQTGPDSWEVRPATKICNEQTTIKEMLDWLHAVDNHRNIEAIRISRATTGGE